MTVNKELTQRGVERLHYHGDGKPSYHWDALVKGFALRISPNGKKVWHVQARCKGKLLTMTLGDLGLIPSVKEAREKARGFILACRDGRDPVAARRQQEA